MIYTKSMCSKQNKKFSFHNKYLQSIYYPNVNIKLIVENITQVKSGIMINANVSAKIQDKNNEGEKTYIWNPSEYLTSTINNLVIIFDEIRNATDLVSTIVTNVLPRNETNTMSTNYLSTLIFILKI